MGNSKVQISYFNGLSLNPDEEKACINYLASSENVVTITQAAGKYWRKLKLANFIRSIDQWDIQRTLLVQKVLPFPLPCIQNVKFPFLMNLSLQSNSISSIECINRIWMPSLEVLDLSRNKIRSVRPLRRINCPKLRRIYIHTNAFLDSNWLAELPTDLEQIGISNQVSVDWSFKTYIYFSDFGRKSDLLRFYNLRGARSIIILDLMINF